MKLALADEVDAEMDWSEISSTQLSSTSGNNDEDTSYLSGRKNKRNSLKVVQAKKESSASSEQQADSLPRTHLKTTSSSRGFKAEDLERIDLEAIVKAATKSNGTATMSSDDTEEALIQNLVRKVLALNSTIQEEGDGNKKTKCSASTKDKKKDKDADKKKKPSKKERETSLKAEPSDDGKRSKSRSKSRSRSILTGSSD
jgi:hypothetical protein